MSRRFAFSRIGDRAVALVNDDATDVFTISPYDEDGSAVRLDERGRERPVTGERWILRRVLDEEVVLRDADGLVTAIEDRAFERGDVATEEIQFGLPTRTAALDAAATWKRP